MSLASIFKGKYWYYTMSCDNCDFTWRFQSKDTEKRSRRSIMAKARSEGWSHHMIRDERRSVSKTLGQVDICPDCTRRALEERLANEGWSPAVDKVTGGGPRRTW